MNAAANKKTFFTVDEANQRLPLVRAIVDDIVHLYRDVHDRRERLAKMRQRSGSVQRDKDNVYSEEVQQIEEELEKDIVRVDEFVDELRELGVILQDPIVGLIDFPTLIDGREAYLCWRLGEEEIGFWHEIDAGFQGRQSLLEKSFSGDSSDEEES